MHVIESERDALHAEALALLTRAAEADPDDPAAHYALGVAQANARRLADAVRSARACIAAARGGHAGGWCLLGLVLGAQGRYTLAVDVLEAALAELEPHTDPLLLTIMVRGIVWNCLELLFSSAVGVFDLVCVSDLCLTWSMLLSSTLFGERGRALLGGELLGGASRDPEPSFNLLSTHQWVALILGA